MGGGATPFIGLLTKNNEWKLALISLFLLSAAFVYTSLVPTSPFSIYTTTLVTLNTLFTGANVVRERKRGPTKNEETTN
jgi:hypothetical protein